MAAAAEEPAPVPSGSRREGSIEIKSINNASPKEDKKERRNTKNLSSRLLVDGMSAAIAGGLVAPIITVVDKCIIENASGKRSMSVSIRASFTQLLLRPHKFLTSRPFLLIFALYGGTYLTANTLDTTKATLSNRPASTTTSGLSKFTATSAANLSLCIYKDSQFTKMFGTVSPRPIPPITYALFAARDSLTIFASFNLPPVLAPRIPLSEAAEQYVSRATVAQFLIPAGMQVFSTPLHLLGLDLYNRNGGTTARERWVKVKADWGKSAVARMCRIVPAFGVGGVVNTGVRRRWMEGLE